MAFLDLAGFRAIVIGTLLLAAYTVYGIVYRLYLSPIAKFPGPKLAAVTFWYEFYYDVIKRGRYTYKIGELHDKYGPIIRINPYELHVRDHEFLPVLYPLQTKSVEKWRWAIRMFGYVDAQTFGTISHDLHHIRRKAISPFFAKQNVEKFSPVIQRNVDRLCQRLEICSDQGARVNLLHQFAGMTADIVSEYAFGVLWNSNEDAITYGARNHKMWMSQSEYAHTMKQFPWLIHVLNALPEWLAKATNPEAYDKIQLDKRLAHETSKLLSRGDDEKSPATPMSILESIYNNPDLPDSEKTMDHLTAEGYQFLGAGTPTTSHALKMTTYHLLANPPILERLHAELLTVSSHPPTLRMLESLPYLSAVCHEGLRMSVGVNHRLQRIHPDQALQYQNWTIPPGTPVGMTNGFMANNEAIFPEPTVFRPERWIGPDAPDFYKDLNVFGRGSRQCVGINLGWAELRMTLAAVVVQFGTRLQLDNVVRERDIDLYHDFFNPLSKAGVNEGLMVRIAKGT